MPPLIYKYYESWINSTTLLDDHSDRERFYRFAKACVRYGRTIRNGQWLRHFLERDLAKKFVKEYTEYEIQRAVSLFDHLIDYHRVNFPDAILEMRNPYSVKAELQRIKKADGSHFYSEDKIKDILNKNFGEWKSPLTGRSWSAKYINKTQAGMKP